MSETELFATIPIDLRRHLCLDRYGDAIISGDDGATLVELRRIAQHADQLMDQNHMSAFEWGWAFRLWVAVQLAIARRWPQHRWHPTEPTAVAMLAGAHEDARRWREAKAAGMLH